MRGGEGGREGGEKGRDGGRRVDSLAVPTTTTSCSSSSLTLTEIDCGVKAHDIGTKMRLETTAARTKCDFPLAARSGTINFLRAPMEMKLQT